jgi:hypothetical protein
MLAILVCAGIVVLCTALFFVLVWAWGVPPERYPESQFSVARARRLAQRLEQERADSEKETQVVAQEIAAIRQVEQKLQNADEKKRKIEMLKIQFEAALLVDAPSTLDIGDEAFALADDAEERTRIDYELQQISAAVREIQKELSSEKQKAIREYLERTRKGESGESSFPGREKRDFRDIFGTFLSAPGNRELTRRGVLRWPSISRN